MKAILCPLFVGLLFAALSPLSAQSANPFKRPGTPPEASPPTFDPFAPKPSTPAPKPVETSTTPPTPQTKSPLPPRVIRKPVRILPPPKVTIKDGSLKNPYELGGKWEIISIPIDDLDTKNPILEDGYEPFGVYANKIYLKRKKTKISQTPPRITIPKRNSPFLPPVIKKKETEDSKTRLPPPPPPPNILPPS